MRHRSYIVIAAASLLLTGCAYDEYIGPENTDNGAGKINLSGEINQEFKTRANDEGFANGDAMGVYIVDYEGNNPGTLLSKGNRGDNVRHTFDEESYRWNSAYDLYWKDNHTRIDVYSYYPIGSPETVNSYDFTVLTDQAKMPTDGTMGNYEASDFLWGKVAGVEPTTNVIRLPMTHRMANARVTLVEGSGFESGEWSSLKKQVLVTNTIQKAVIDLSTGEVKPNGKTGETSIIPTQRNDEWRAIVVPQTITAGTQLFSITIDGIPYKFSKSEDFTYIAGKMNNFGIKVDKKSPAGQYTLTLISESITPWENDLVSHDATAKEYVVVNSTPGGLKDAITVAGKDFKTLKNLKVTGEINGLDFSFMREQMDMLHALNLKEVKIVDTSYNDRIPPDAFSNKKSLNRLVLPDKLIAIEGRAFEDCSNLAGSLEIPEGVIEINTRAFYNCASLTGALSLPTTLRHIGNYAFYLCSFNCELLLPDNLEEIEDAAFQGVQFYGSLHLPHKLKSLGKHCFYACRGFKGNLEIPQNIKEIPDFSFGQTGFDGSLILHDGINRIGEYSFSGSQFVGELILPKNLTAIENGAFDDCKFSGSLVLPPNIVTIGRQAFYRNQRIRGTINFPDGLINIGANAFAYCGDIEGIVFPESIENIGTGAFLDCFGIGSIVSNSSIPPHVQSSAFNGVAKDNFTLEVPESAVELYQTALGWSEFKRIAAHHELVCRPAVACALSTEHHQQLIINAEGEWEVASKPNWCQLSQTSGDKKTEITLTINATAKDGSSREGDVVFRLKGKDYTHKCHVTQYGYEYGEDEYLTLQSATKGNRGGINIVILGDGYDAKDISDGTYLTDMRQQIEYFFDIEPYKTYRNYFNVYTAFPLSTGSGVGTVNTIRYNRFNTTYTSGVGLKCDYDAVFAYALNAPTVSNTNLDETLIIIVPNSTDYGGICQMWESGAAIAFCPKSADSYPYDSRGIIQHEAGGHGFGKLGDEYIYHNAFIDVCQCWCCKHVDDILRAKSLGWYDNLEITGKTHAVGWSYLIFDPRYSDIVDVFEGGFMHARGVFRSEQNSCMNNNIPYYSTFSRLSIVRRIKSYAGEAYSYEDFVANDKRGAGSTTRSSDFYSGPSVRESFGPVIHKGNPVDKLRKRKRR